MLCELLRHPPQLVVQLLEVGDVARERLLERDGDAFGRHLERAGVVAAEELDWAVPLDGVGKILPADFGLVQVGTFADAEARVPVPPVGVMGGTLYVNFGTIGFQRASKTKQPDIEVSLRVLDAKNQPTFAKPLTGHVSADVPDDVRIVPMQFGLTMNRVGNFTIELTARDVVAGKTSVVTLPVRILALE